jgi:transcriptional regulator with XRE-family HTH domain
MPHLALLSERIDQLTSQFGITDAQFAAVLHVQPRTVERWRAEEAFPQHESRQRFEALLALAGRLGESFKTPRGEREWLHAESGYFGGLKPIDALLRGRIDLVDAALEALDSGVFV